MYKVKPNVGMMFKFQFHYENGDRVDLQKASNAIVEIRTVDSSSNITSSFADDFGYDLTNNCMWVRFSADAVVTVGNVVSANLTVQIRNTTGAYEYITTAAFVNLFVISNDDDASSVNGVIIDKPVKLSAAGLSITAHSPYINADGYWVYYSDDNKTWIVSTYKATNDVIVDKDSVTHLKDGSGNGSLVSTNDDKSSAGNTAIGLNCISLGSKNSNAGTSDVVLLGNGNRAKSSAINAVGVAGADVDASVSFAVGEGRTGNPGCPKNVFAVSPLGDILYRPSTDTDRLANLQNTLNLGFIDNLSYNKTSKKIYYYVYTPNENFPSEHKQCTIDLSTLVSGDKTVTDTTYNSTTNEITVTYDDGTTSTFALNDCVKSFVRTFQKDSPVCSDFVTDQYGTVTTLFSPALFIKEPQTSLVLNNVNTGNSGGQTEYFKWFYNQYQIDEGESSAVNTFFNLPIDFATKPDCTPFDSSHVIVPTLSCMNGALANYIPLTGNAATATKLNTARNIGLSGVTATTQSFDGTANITIPITAVPAALLTGTASISTTGNAATATKATQDGNGNVITSTYLSLAGGTLTGDIIFSDSGTATKGIYGTIGSSDSWRLIGGAYANDSGWLELATANDGTEPIYVRQYVGYDGTNPYNDFGNIVRTATLLDESGNTSFPGTVTASAFSGNAATATKTVGTLTVTENGTSVGTFNGSADTTIALTGTTYSDATTTTHGLMTATDKVKLNGITSDINTINQTLPKCVRTTNNLINSSENNINFYLTKTGGLQTYTGGRVSGYIPVIPTQILKYSGSYGSSACGIAFYDTNKTFISYQYESASITDNVKGLGVTIPNNCAYIRVSSLATTDEFKLSDTGIATNEALENRVTVVENSMDELESNINLDANNIKGTKDVESYCFGTAITEDSAYKEIDVTQIIYSASKVCANNKIFVCKLSTDTNSMTVEQKISIPDAVIGQNTVNVSFVLQKGRVLYILGNDIYNGSNSIIPGSNVNIFQANGLPSKNIGDTQNVTQKVTGGKEIRIIGVAKDVMKTAIVQYLISEAIKNKANNILNGLVLSVTGDSEAAGNSIGKENTYGNLIALRNGMTINNYAVNGRALKTGSATSLVDTYQEIALNSNYILIQIGYNDSFDANIADDSVDKTTFKGAFNVLATGLQSRYPDAKIGFIEPYYFQNTSLKPRAEWIKTRCEFYHIQCIDGTVKSGLRYDCAEQAGYFIDEVHLTKSGHLRMSYIYEDFLKGL